MRDVIDVERRSQTARAVRRPVEQRVVIDPVRASFDRIGLRSITVDIAPPELPPNV